MHMAPELLIAILFLVLHYTEKVRVCVIALYGKPITELWSITCHMGSLRWMHSVLTPARQTVTRFTYPGGIVGWVDLAVGYIPR